MLEDCVASLHDMMTELFNLTAWQNCPSLLHDSTVQPHCMTVLSMPHCMTVISSLTAWQYCQACMIVLSMPHCMALISSITARQDCSACMIVLSMPHCMAVISYCMKVLPSLHDRTIRHHCMTVLSTQPALKAISKVNLLINAHSL